MANISILNTVQATHADYSKSGGVVRITGLDEFKYKDWKRLQTSHASSYYDNSSAAALVQGFQVLDTNTTIAATTGTAGTATSGTGSPDYFQGDAIEVTKGGSTWYAIFAQANQTASPATYAAWVSASGTVPADAAGYTFTRKGHKFTKVTFVDITASLTTVEVVLTNPLNRSLQIPLATWGYTTATTATKTVQANAFAASISAVCAANGYYCVSDGVDTVYIMHPPNLELYVTVSSASVATYIAPTVVAYQPTATIGYGADMILAYGTASSATANDGIVATNFYDRQVFYIEEEGNPVPKMLTLLINVTTEATDGPALSAFLEGSTIAP